EVRQHEIDRRRGEAIERLGAVGGRDHREAGVAERGAETLARGVAILGEQNLRAPHRAPSGPSCGSSTRNTVRPGADSTSTEPPCARAASRQSESPIPKPSRKRLTPGSKISLPRSAGTPTPSSATSSTTCGDVPRKTGPRRRPTRPPAGV